MEQQSQTVDGNSQGNLLVDEDVEEMVEEVVVVVEGVVVVDVAGRSVIIMGKKRKLEVKESDGKELLHC